MKRLRRFIFIALNLLSLMVCMTMVGFWIRSYFVSDQLLYTTPKPLILGVAYGKGTLDFVRATFDPSAFIETPDSLALQKPKAGLELTHEKPDERNDWQDVQPQRQIRFLGAKYRSGQIVFFHAQDITIRFWMLVLLFGIYPAIRLIRHRRRRSGHCPTCGYSLTGNVSGTCPECGTATDRKATGNPN